MGCAFCRLAPSARIRRSQLRRLTEQAVEAAALCPQTAVCPHTADPAAQTDVTRSQRSAAMTPPLPPRSFPQAPDGTIRLLTWRAFSERRLAGLLLCPSCGKFFPDGRGMRDHQQIVHTGRSYEAALGAALEARRALVPLRGNVALAQSSSHASHDSNTDISRRETKAKLQLEPGLAAARNGAHRTGGAQAVPTRGGKPVGGCLDTTPESLTRKASH